MIYLLDRANLQVMEILKRLTTPSIPKEEVVSGVYPCQFCGEPFKDDDEMVECHINLMLPPTNTGKRHVHVECLLSAAEAIKKGELDLKTKEHLADLDELDDLLVES